MIQQKYTIKNITRYIAQSLTNLYPAEECLAIARIVTGFVLKMDNWQLHRNAERIISIEEEERILSMLGELVHSKPVQYVVGESWFYGMKFSVNANVLIPRRETEELVDWIVKEHSNNKPVILDIGTGSGCIAVALAKNITNSKVYALDVSEAALDVARKNAIENGVAIEFIKKDIFKDLFDEGLCFDIIVSNPPYVTYNEKKELLPNVIDYEPSVALFVPDNDPLIFYKKIIKIANDLLKPDGAVYFEINEKYGSEITVMLMKEGYTSIALKKDMQGKDRMIKAILSG